MKEELFSQNGQEYFLEKIIFSKIKNGFFVDIGANDGTTFSNTYFFEKKGWTGVCIEPIEHVFNKLKSIRSCRCVHGVISEKKDEFVEFLYVSGSLEMLSGILEKYDKNHTKRLNLELSNNKEDKNIIKVRNYNFNKIIDKYDIDYLSIDTEGSEFDILKSIDFSKYNIKAISIENDYGNDNIYTFLKSHGFLYLKTLGSDEIYINKKNVRMLKNKIILTIQRSYFLFKKIIKKYLKIFRK